MTTKLPPQAIESERYVLGSILSETGLIDQYSDILSESIFYLDEHVLIFNAIEKLVNDAKPVDVSTVFLQMKKSKTIDRIGGITAITDLTSNIGSTARIEFHIKVLQEKQIARELISVGNEMINKAFDPASDALELQDHYATALSNVGLSAIKDVSISNAQRAIDAERADFDQRTIAFSNKRSTGVPSASKALDGITGGYQKGWLIIKGGDPGAGKTSDAIAEFCTALKQGFCPIFFTIEMTELQLVQKMVIHESNGLINGDDLRSGNLNNVQVQLMSQIHHDLKQHQWWIYERTVGVNRIRSITKKIKSQYPVEIIFVDYVQRVKPDGKSHNKVDQISEVGIGLKSLAKELKIAVVAISSFSRASKKEGTVREPIMSDLRGSGDLEFEADLIVLFHRPAYYGQMEYENESSKGVILRIIAKFRFGRTGKLIGYHNEQISNFYDYRHDIPYGQIEPEPTVRQLQPSNHYNDDNPF